MDIFESTSKRMQQIKNRIPDFPLDLMRLMRMTNNIQKHMRDLTNAALKEHDLNDVSYIVLAVLYGSPEETSAASALSQACHEKPANLTRVCNELEARGLITRGARPGDRRSVMITLTGKGRELTEAILPLVWNATMHAYDGFNAKELKQLEEMYLRQLHNIAESD